MKTHITTEAKTENKAVLEFDHTKARKRITAIKHGGWPVKGDYELGCYEIRAALLVIEENNRQNKTLTKYMIKVGQTLCAGSCLPVTLRRRMLRRFNIKPGDTLTVENGTAKV